MSESNRRRASLVGWKSPEDQPMSIASVEDKQGLLEVEIENGAVTIRRKHCRFTWCEVKKKEKQGEKVIAEAEITVPLAQYQINWTCVEEWRVTRWCCERNPRISYRRREMRNDS